MSKKFNSNTSTSSLDQDDLTSDERHVQVFAKQMLQGRFFIGIFHEKRYVNILNSYRDVVSVFKDERDLIKDIDLVKKRIENYYTTNHWVGITNQDVSGTSANVWVELPADQPFGCYWFKIKTVKFKEREATLRLKVLRPYEVNNDATKTIPSLTSDEVDDLNINFDAIKNYFITNLKYCVNNVTTMHNTKEMIIFISVLLVAAVTGSFQLLQFLCDFVLKFMREASHFIQSATPIFIACINLVGKSIGGLYMLIAMMWRDRKSPAPSYYTTPSYNPMVSYDVNSRRVKQRALPSSRSYRRGVTITEVE